MRSCDIDNRKKMVEILTTPIVRDHISNEYGVEVIPLQRSNELRIWFKSIRTNSEPFTAATNIKGLFVPFSNAFENIKSNIYGAELVLYFNQRNSDLVSKKIAAMKASKDAWLSKRNLDEESLSEIEEEFSKLNQSIPPIQISTGNEFVVEGEVLPTFEDARNKLYSKKEYSPNYLFNNDVEFKPEESLPLSDSNSDFSIPCIIK